MFPDWRFLDDLRGLGGGCGNLAFAALQQKL
jgi:hypothetical protein